MDIINQIKAAGVVGAGGAGFPSHVKFSGEAEYFLINAAECEPLLGTDKYLMRHKSREIIETIELLGKHLGVKKAIIGIKKKSTQEIQALQEAIQHLDASVTIHEVENFYPAGDEHILVYELVKRQVPPAGIPKDVGVVVSNVGTLLSIKEALEEKPVTHKLVSVVGEVENPSLWEVPIGTSVDTCVKMAGGATLSAYKGILGGPMMGRILEAEELKTQVITKTTAAIILLPSDHSIFKRQEQSFGQMINRARSACIQCSLCTDLCPRNMIGHPLRPHRIMRSLGIDYQQKETLKEALLCCECGVCESFACPMGLSPRRINGEIKKMLMEKGIKGWDPLDLSEIHPMRGYRQVPAERLMARLDILGYEAELEDCSWLLEPKEVRIPLKQHIGNVATPVVKVGDLVEQGQLIGDIRQDSLGAKVHASISGRVTNIEEAICIEVKEKVGVS